MSGTVYVNIVMNECDKSYVYILSSILGSALNVVVYLDTLTIKVISNHLKFKN